MAAASNSNPAWGKVVTALRAARAGGNDYRLPGPVSIAPAAFESGIESVFPGFSLFEGGEQGTITVERLAAPFSAAQGFEATLCFPVEMVLGTGAPALVVALLGEGVCLKVAYSPDDPVVTGEVNR